jgi:hypothetical protein
MSSESSTCTKLVSASAHARTDRHTRYYITGVHAQLGGVREVVRRDDVTDLGSARTRAHAHATLIGNG